MGKTLGGMGVGRMVGVIVARFVPVGVGVGKLLGGMGVGRMAEAVVARFTPSGVGLDVGMSDVGLGLGIDVFVVGMTTTTFVAICCVAAPVGVEGGTRPHEGRFTAPTPITTTKSSTAMPQAKADGRR